MATSEQDRVRQIRNGCILGNQAGERFGWNDVRKTIEPADYMDPDQPTLPVTVADMGHAASRGRVAQ